MPMHSGQKEILKELILEPIVTTITDAYPVLEALNDVAFKLLLALQFSPDAISSRYIANFDKDSEDVVNATIQLSKLYWGEVDLSTTFGDDVPSLYGLRVMIHEMIIEALHETYPEYAESHPVLSNVDNLEGMEKIRELFKQYATMTASGSLERYLLALKIIKEKEGLCLPSFISSKDNIFASGGGYAPGDFSYLDLSCLDLKCGVNGHGNFKGWALKNSSFEGTNFDELCLWGANFEGANLRGADLSQCREKNEGLVLLGANIEGAYFGEDYVPDRRAHNFSLISKTKEDLERFRKEKLQNPYAVSSVGDSDGSDDVLEKENNESIVVNANVVEDCLSPESPPLVFSGNRHDHGHDAEAPQPVNTRKRQREEESSDDASEAHQDKRQKRQKNSFCVIL